MNFLQTLIYDTAGYCWSIFSCLGEIAIMPLAEAVNGYIVSSANPFNDFICTLSFTGSPVLGQLIDWLGSLLPIYDTTVIGFILLVIPAVFSSLS